MKRGSGTRASGPLVAGACQEEGTSKGDALLGCHLGAARGAEEPREQVSELAQPLNSHGPGLRKTFLLLFPRHPPLHPQGRPRNRGPIESAAEARPNE